VDVPKKDDEGNVIQDETGDDISEVLLEVDYAFTRLSSNGTRDIFTKVT
jgi:hypothetical protein